MSFESEYLELRKQRSKSVDAGTESTSQNGNSGASSRDDYTSEYLNLRNQRNTESFSSRVDSRVRDITKALESFQNQASKSQPGTYYSMPKLGEKKDALSGNVNRIRADMAKTYSDVESAQKSLKQAESDMNTVKGYLEQAKAAYDNNPSEELATQYNQIVGAYNLAYQIYGHAYDIYSAAYEMYKPYEDKLVNAMADYQVYMNQQQKKYDDWKGSIRDSETIQREMEQIDGQIALLEELEKEQKKEKNNAQWNAKPWYEKLALSLGGAQDTTLPGGTMSGNGIKMPEEVSPEMQALLNKKALLQEEYGWSRYFPYADLVNQPDFSEKSKYVSTENGQKQRSIDIMMGNYSGGSQWDDPLYEYVNGNEEAGAYISNAAANAYGADNAIGSAFGRATESKAEARQMTDEEVSIFNYLYATQGKDAAHEYYSYLQSDLNYRQRREDEKYWADYAAKNPTKASALSWVMAPTKGLSYLGQAADYLTGGEIDQNAAYNKYSYAGSAIRGQVAKVIEDSGKWGKVGSFAYQTAMSMADFLLNTAITGANQTVTLAIMGTGAAADATIEAKDRGLTDDQAFALGTIAGLAEVVTEKVSLETLLNPDLLANGAGKYVLKNMLAEGSEEVGSDLINLFADVLISKDQSEWHKSMAAYVEDGKTQSEAFGLAMADQAAEMGLDFLGGALSGGLMSGVNAGIHVNYTGKLGSELAGMDLSEEDVQAFIETGLESDPETASYKLAVEMQEKLDAGKALSSNDLARLWQANMAAIEDEEKSGKQQEDAEAKQTNTAEQPVQSQRTQPMAVEDTKISVAEKLRQEQGAIGGTQNVNTDEQRQRFTAAEPAEAGRTNLSDGIQGRYAGQSAAEQAGSLEASPVQKQSVARSDGSRAAIERQNTARYLRLEKVSSKELGLESGTEAKNIQVMPQEHWDAEMTQLADRIYNETGKGVSYVLGRIQVRSAGGTVGYARGVISGDKIIVQADNLRVPMSKIADHEAYHAKADFVGNGRLNAEIKQHIISNFSEEQFQKVLEKYIVGLRGVYNVEDAKTTEAYERLVAQIEEEIFADAYAGINAFGADADQFTESVNERMDQLYMGKIRNQENGIEQPTGPPAERYSYAGENANTADLEALERAKQMKKAGVADETIRKETGWFIGMDGKWRWEIDDSKMRFDRTGDLRGATSAKWAQEDLNNARDDLWGHADLDTLNKVRAYNRACVQDDANTMKQLYDELIHGNSAYYFGQYVEALNRTRETRRIVGGTLQDYIDHPALFEAYPQFKDVKLRFENLADGNLGYFDRNENEIVLSSGLMDATEDVLIHEIQHAIQKEEDFARGASMEYWQQRQDGDKPVKEYDEKIKNTREQMESILKSLPENVSEQFRQYAKMDNENSPEAERLASDLEKGPYGDQFEDFYMCIWALDDWKKNNWKRGAYDLYRNTAGEIEARDAASRRNFSQEQRRNKKPSQRNWRTVFAEKNQGLAKEQDSAGNVEVQENEELSLPTLENENQIIHAGMDDTERAKVLAQKEIQVPAYDSGNPVTGAQIIKLKGKYISEARKLIKVLAENCGLFNRGYYNADVDLQFEYSRRSMHESINKQANRGSGAEEFGKMLTVLPQICENAVEIEAHMDKYAATKRMDSNLKEIHVLLSAFRDGDTITPVQLEIKEYQQEKGQKDKLYLTVTLKETEAGISLRAPADTYAQPSIHSTPASTINLADLIANVKDDTGDLVKYLPDEMLNQEQMEAKAAALEREAERLGDMQYEYAVEKGDTEKAEGMLRTKAVEKGYEAGDDWRMNHRAPNAESGTVLSNADMAYGNDGSIYSPAAATYYGEGRPYDGKALVAFNKARSNPEAMIPVYRAVPGDIQDAKLRNGDWVTPTREYAVEHGEMYFDGDYRIVKETVPAKFLYVNGDSIHEFGYDNGRTNEVYKNTRNNVKLAGITYDNAGRLIPLSSRYDERNSDIRYSLDDEAGEQEKKQETAYTKGDVSAETIEEDIRKVARMESVTKITGNEFQKGEKDLVTQVKEFFDGLDKRAYNPQLGSITLDKEGVKSDLGHGMGRKKAAAFAAVPDVLARGFVVDYQKNWKGRGYDTAVVAAPIQIGDGDYLMGIVLNRNQSKNKFYVHEVLTTENGASPFKTGTRKGNPSGDTPSVISILDKIRTVKNQTGTSEKFSTDNESDVQLIQEQKKTVQKKTVGPVAESRPTIAKRDLRKTVLNLFSIPSGQRAELGSVIDSYADRLIKNGSLSWEDRESFFDRMYASGVMTVAADELYAEGRNYLKGGRIYVSDSVVADLGDDWNDIRRRAFAAGIYLTRSRMTNNVQNMGIDGWNDYLASDLPGLFNSEETDQRSILERIIQVAEEGKDEKMSLPEYTAWLAETEHQSEDEFLDNMERQLDWALRTFAEKANLEVTIKDRTEKKIANDREARKESARKAQQNKELRELQQKTLKQLQWLNRNRNRAPEELKSTWDEVLSDIDLYAVGAANEMNWSDKYNATWKDLAQMYKDAQKNDPNFLPSKELERIVTRLDGTKIEDMDLGALQDLYKAAIGLRTEFYNRNNIINDEQQRLFAEVYTDAKREIETAPGKYTGNPVEKFINLDQLTPMNVMQRMGGWDPDGAFYSMAKQLERGERDMRAYTVKANRMLQDFLTEHENWVKRADGQGKDAIWYELEVPELLQLGMGDKPIFGDTVKVYMTPVQKVHMYLESKNVDNLRHMTGGRTFVDKDLYSKGKRKEAFSQGKTVRLAPETVKKIVSDLTPEELELARVLEQYYNSFATKEINKVSNVLYGYDKAMGKNYAPIYTNRNYTKTEFGVFDTTAEGVGNLKGRQYAVNPSYNISALDAFERHVEQTARFCGMAIPARNWTTLMNWREKNNSTGDVITHKWGEESKNYISDLITRLQSGDDYAGDTISKGVDKLMSNYISAVFGANPSIVLKQLGSIPLASAYLDAKNFPSVSQIRSIDRNLISKYTQDLEWRTMGYSMPETKQLKENPNWTQSNKVFGFLFGGDAITAMDGWAASVLWPWAENKVRRENPNLEIGNNAQIESGESPFYKKVAEEFENAVARSQSTSDEIHQGTLRKSKNPFTRAFTMFRSDSAQTYNTLRQKIGEAQYYARTGAKQNTIRMAKKAVGSAFLSAVVGYMWAEGVEFLMNLWKHKGKKYRDDDDELTAGSVIGEMVSGLVGDMAGVVTGGEELYDFIGGILTDGTWFGIDTMGMEQLNDCLESIFNAGKKIRDIVADGKDVLENGGDLGEYFRRHGNDMLGGIKDLAMVVATYFPGLPVNNLEAYLMGAVKWVSPEIQTAYEDLLATAEKNGLNGLEGDALTGRIGSILDNRKISESDETAQILGDLYAAGYKAAVPGDTPASVSVNGETRKLGAYQQQTYDMVWGSVVADALDEMIYSDSFSEADQKTQAKVLSNLYSYAAERAKAELFDEYEMNSSEVKNAEIVAAGASVAECITWNTVTGDMKSGEKAAELASWNLPDKAKRAIFRNKISDSREDTIAAFRDAGLSFNQFLQTYSKYSEINNMDMKAGEKAVEFSSWINRKGYTSEQAAVIKDELKYFNMTPASAGRYDELVSTGMDLEDAYNLVGVLNGLEPEEGKIAVNDMQRWRASVDFSNDIEDQLNALYAVMDNKQFAKVEIAYDFGVTPDAYVTLQEIKSRFDADGNEYYSNAEIKAAIDSMSGLHTKEQKAALWQLATGSKSAKNNPYSREIGQKVIDAREAKKESEAFGGSDYGTGEVDSFSKEIMDQLLGRG